MLRNSGSALGVGREDRREGGTEITDRELVARAQAGEEAAFHDLVVRFQRPVFALVVRMVRDAALAEDLCQEVFLKTHRHLGSYDPDRKFSSWLFKIAHNTTLDYLRKKKLDTVPLESEIEGVPDRRETLADPKAVSPDSGLERGDILETLNTAVAELRPEYREVVLLRFQQDLSYQEIAEITDQPMGTVKTHLHRARKELVTLLEARGLGPGGPGPNFETTAPQPA